jgi:hypothetical protein
MDRWSDALQVIAMPDACGRELERGLSKISENIFQPTATALGVS